MSGRGAVHLCSFDAGPKVTRRLSYEDFRAEVLKAGRFSVFEATETPCAAQLYSRLCRDPEIETTTLVFPWTGVKKRRATP